MAEPTEPAVDSVQDATGAAAPVHGELAAAESDVRAVDDAAAPVAPTVGEDAEAAVTTASEQGPERVGRGILLSLLLIPAGVIAWTVIWQLGFMSAIVAFGVAVGGAWLYRRGSGGRIGPVGIVSTIVVTMVTLVLSFLAGLVTDLATFLEIDIWTAITSPEFWDLYFLNIFDSPELWSELTGDILFALLFAALGTFSVFWNLAKAAKAAKQAGAV
ncbi:hypothetical protein [Microbacterium sulfonylureivorans]|uniref:hypothetical protein n=1 Tax=Microbacterium sulfonylureivorans TaxID=2486854 RepID=UPI000FDA4736|nr:hypothetical protein [Microbacterium sulfonylureivorans]